MSNNNNHNAKLQERTQDLIDQIAVLQKLTRSLNSIAKKPHTKHKLPLIISDLRQEAESTRKKICFLKRSYSRYHSANNAPLNKG